MAEICTTNYSNVTLADICRQGNLVQLRVYISGGALNANTTHNIANFTKLKPLKRVITTLVHQGGNSNASVDFRADGNMWLWVENTGGYYSANITYLTTDY